jgi:protein KTI12
MVSAIIAEQSGMKGQLNLSFNVGSSQLKQQITLPARNITLSELQRLKRSFVTVHKKAITLGTTEKGAVDWSEESVAWKFATYLQEHIKP